MGLTMEWLACKMWLAWYGFAMLDTRLKRETKLKDSTGPNNELNEPRDVPQRQICNSYVIRM